MRTKNSMFNMAASFGSQIITVLLGFISRTVFITALGAEYLGVNGLFTNILSIISLAESGIGSSIVYSLYKPVAERLGYIYTSEIDCDNASCKITIKQPRK